MLRLFVCSEICVVSDDEGVEVCGDVCCQDAQVDGGMLGIVWRSFCCVFQEGLLLFKCVGGSTFVMSRDPVAFLKAQFLQFP